MPASPVRCVRGSARRSAIAACFFSYEAFFPACLNLNLLHYVLQVAISEPFTGDATT
jgi:hypothetical protein